MATIRGFSLAKISKIKIVFSTFDSRVGSVRFMALCVHVIVCAVYTISMLSILTVHTLTSLRPLGLVIIINHAGNYLDVSPLKRSEKPIPNVTLLLTLEPTELIPLQISRLVSSKYLHTLTTVCYHCLFIHTDDGSSLNFSCVKHKALDMIAQINQRSKTL